MCLYNLVSTKTRNPEFKISRDKKGYYGWKIYRSIDSYSAAPRFKGRYQSVGKWIKSTSCEGTKKIQSSCGNWYPAGFHVYLKRRKELGHPTKKVYIKKVVAKGYQGRFSKCPCFICKELFIPKPRKETRREW